ncbi:10799_t:CDS:2 [Diversispora eburnea]|uniref:10799_t:CDS:1 n=1 Tax=Diversispora eburnea TaxID=1213867 RepID=A0A9N8W5S1_9GLOM|nr:10799_t:CDS:2 [Diversispora eburnea]
MTTNTIITTEITIKQTTSKSSAANSNVQLAKNITQGQKNIPNNGFIIKPTHIPVDKEIVNHGNHISPARIGTPSGRRPGRPRKSETSKLN